MVAVLFLSQTAEHVKKSNRTTAYFDATGSIVKDSKLLYYAMICPTDLGPLPIVEVISEDNKAYSVYNKPMPVKLAGARKLRKYIKAY